MMPARPTDVTLVTSYPQQKGKNGNYLHIVKQ